MPQGNEKVPQSILIYAPTASSGRDFYSELIQGKTEGAYAGVYADEAINRREGHWTGESAVDRVYASVTAVDISDVGITSAKRWVEQNRANNIELKVMDVEKLDFADSSFDIVCGASILHHVDTMSTIAEASRVLKPDGHAIFLDTMGHNPLFKLYRKITPHGRTSYEHPLHADELRRMGWYFKDVDARYFQMLAYAAIPFRKMGQRGLTSAFESLDDALFRTIPFLGRYASNVVITLKQPKNK
jgi:ubiquinone/menaquinone biosynthesis C-methylase UbiE